LRRRDSATLTTGSDQRIPPACAEDSERGEQVEDSCRGGRTGDAGKKKRHLWRAARKGWKRGDLYAIRSSRPRETTMIGARGGEESSTEKTKDSGNGAGRRTFFKK